MDDYISRAEHNEYAKKVDERDREHVKRIETVEQTVKQLEALTYSVEKLANNMQRMCDVQEEQGKRLEALEKKPLARMQKAGNTAQSAFITAVITAVVTAIITWLIASV